MTGRYLNEHEVQRSKKLQRAQALGARNALSAETRSARSDIVSQKLLQHPAVLQASVILSYMAFGAELDLADFHSAIAKEGKTLAFPVTFGKGHMEAYQPLADDAWSVDAAGIRSPEVERSLFIEPGTIDVVIVPCVAFDAGGWRMGWGGGHYDRYLPRCPKAHLIGVAFEVQRVDSVVVIPGRDIRLDEVMTEAESP
jgi:5-formyltetrahydrofolate cyclo-ligase